MSAITPQESSFGKAFPVELEKEYRATILASDRRMNFRALIVAIPLYALYSLIDAITLVNALEGAAFRVGAAAVAALPLLAMRLKSQADRHDALTAISVATLGFGINLIVWNEPNLEHNYYVALIQGGIFVSFLVRLNFAQSLLILASFLVLFIAAIAGKEPREDALLQIFILVTMFTMCGFGIHLTQTLRRRDFLKSKTIARQNLKLNEMLADVQHDNARKVAAMNLLVHFVKTPVHQIVGFTDLVTQSLESAGENAPKDTIESARFIKSASRELSLNVGRLLVYYRLDEVAGSAGSELIELDGLVRDFIDQMPETIRVDATCDKVAILNRQPLVNAALKAIVDHYSDGGATGVSFRLTRTGEGAVLTIEDKLPPMTAEEFARVTKPLDKLDHYLTANGSSMPMVLRTVARALELAGGGFSWSAVEGGNRFALTIADEAQSLQGAAA